jgi:hypothetical protein
MRSMHIAEWILRLVTSRDRAAPTVGDLVEGAATRGAVWFWSGIFRTAGSLLWRSLAENPMRMAKVACGGLAIDVAAGTLIAALTGVVGALIFEFSGGHRLDFNSLWWTIGLHTPTLIASWIVGRALARWAPDRELAACLAYAIAGAIFSVITDMIPPTTGLGFVASVGVFLVDAAQRTPVLAGALWGRRRRMAAP